MKHVDGTPATINGKKVPSTDPEPSPAPIPKPDPQPTPDPIPVPTPEPVPSVQGLKTSYNISSWGAGYQVVFKVENTSDSKVNNWTVKVNKKDVKIESSWCVNVAEEGNYYVITPMSWNSSIDSKKAIEFGIQGTGSIGDTIDCSVQ